jgi:hypothetical protein
MLNVKLRTMKIKNLLKGIMTMLAVFIGTAAFAQDNSPWLDMTETGGTDSVTVNSTMPYYVKPDPILNSISSQYDPNDSNADNNVSSTFRWNIDAGTANLTDPAASGADAPYNEIEFTTEETVSFSVYEESAGGCEDPTGRSIDVEVLPEPTFEVDDGDANIDKEICDGAVEDVFIASLGNPSGTGDGISGESNYEFLLDIQKRIVDGSGGVISENGYPTSNADTIVVVDTTEGTDIKLLSNYTFTCGVDNNGDKRVTEYRFDFGSTVASGSEANGVSNHISRKSDYFSFTTAGSAGTDREKTLPDHSDYSSGYTNIGNYTWYDTGISGADENMITVTVYPTPETGEIYHVPNQLDL